MANGQWQQSVFERGSDQDILELKKLVKQDQAIAEGSPAAGFAIITLTSGSIRLSKVATLAPRPSSLFRGNGPRKSGHYRPVLTLTHLTQCKCNI